jgi:hypothetical protein
MTNFVVDNEMKFHLIELVRRKPFLWNMRSREYHSIKGKRKTIFWETIAIDLRIPR